MGLLFANGVMHLLWMVLSTAFVPVENVVLRDDLMGRLTGGALAIGTVVLFTQGGCSCQYSIE